MTIPDDAKNMVTHKRNQDAAAHEQRRIANEATWRGAIIAALEVLEVDSPRVNYWDKLEPIPWDDDEGIQGWREPPPRFQVRVEDEGLIVRNDNPRYENHIELEEIGTGRKLIVNLVSPAHDDERATRAQWTQQIAEEWYGL
jgi:hypothetical protein